MSLRSYCHCDEYPFSLTEDVYGKEKEIIGPAVYDTYGEDIMIVGPIDFVLSKDAFKTIKVNVRDSLGVIKGETSKSNHIKDSLIVGNRKIHGILYENKEIVEVLSRYVKEHIETNFQFLAVCLATKELKNKVMVENVIN